MYNALGTNLNPYYGNVSTPINDLNVVSRNQQGTYQQVCDAILNGIKKKATDLEFYSRLANAAPNQSHKNVILYAAEGKNFYLLQFTDLYISLTGNEHEYQIDQVLFYSYREGLQKAYESEAVGYQDYRNSSLLSQHPQVQHVFTWACSAKWEYATRFAILIQEVPIELNDYGGEPFVVDIDKATTQNNTYRTCIMDR